jgi:hypothetical protein
VFQSTLKAHKKAWPFLLLEIWILSRLPRNINNLSYFIQGKKNDHQQNGLEAHEKAGKIQIQMSCGTKENFRLF